MVSGQLYGVADSNLAAPDHVTIQGERTPEFPHDVCEHLMILFQAVGIKRRHDAAPTKILDSDDNVSDMQALSGPRALGQALDPADHKVRSESLAIMSKGRDSSIRRDQQGEHVESIARLVANQPCARPNDVHNICADLGIAPQQAANHRLARRIERGMVTEKPMVCSGRDHMTVRVLHMHDAIPLDAKRTDVRVIQPFTTHRFYRVPPNLCHIHGVNSFTIAPACSSFVRTSQPSRISSFLLTRCAPLSFRCCPLTYAAITPGQQPEGQNDLFLERPKGYVKVLEKSTSSLLTMREVFEHYPEND
jgi:hypothetical protein